MKTLTLITCLLLTALTTTVFAARHKTLHGVHVRTADGHIVYFRIGKAMIGADIEIYLANGEKILSRKISKRRALLDFYFENPGTYTITIRKSGQETKFDFVKDDPLPELPEAVEPTLLTDGISNP